MGILNSQRNGCKDVFNAFLVSLAEYEGVFEFPVIKPTYWIPNRLIRFSKAISSTDYDQWIHFFEDDCQFERIWRNPKRYLDILRRYNGVILPDFSLYRDMPFIMQLWNIYRSRAIGCWLQTNGVRVIANIRYGDNRTFQYCCDGIAKHCTIAVGSYGTLKNVDNRKIFSAGLEKVIKTIEPSAVIVYGSVPENIFGKYRQMGIQIFNFESDLPSCHRGGK